MEEETAPANQPLSDENRGEKPRFLYKYRGDDLDRLRGIVLEDALWFSAPSDFNDPYDCFPSIDIKRARQARLRQARASIDEEFSGTPRFERRRAKRALEDATVYKRDYTNAYRDAVEVWTMVADRLGVLSLAERPTSTVMWNHYAHNYTGVCLQFETTQRPFMLAHQVVYSDERPVFRPFDAKRSDLVERLLLRKAEDWSYEREWRIITHAKRNGLRPYAPAALKSIILGPRIAAEKEEAIAAMVRDRAAPVQLKRAVLDERFYEMRIEPI